MAAIAALWAWGSPQPDIYIAANGQLAAVRGANGRLSVLHRARDTFAIREWLAADADPRLAEDKTLTDNVRCDDLGCVGQLRDGKLVAMSLAAAAFADDCVRALIVISAHEGSAEKCHALLLDRRARQGRGAMSLRVQGQHIEIGEARPAGYQRPWTRSIFKNTANSERDATPAINQLEPGD